MIDSISGLGFYPGHEEFEKQIDNQNFLNVYPMNHENINNEQKELVKYWIEKYSKRQEYTLKEFIEKHLSPTPKIEVGKWYHIENGGLWFVEEVDVPTQFGLINYGYGINAAGIFKEKGDEKFGIGPQLFIKEANKEEVKEGLIQEAKRRGYTKGNFKCLRGYTECKKWKDVNPFYVSYLESTKDSVWITGIHTYHLCVFDKGKWAEIVDENVGVKETIARLESELKTLKSQLK